MSIQSTNLTLYKQQFIGNILPGICIIAICFFLWSCLQFMFRLNQSSTVELMRFNDCSVQWVSEIKWSYEQMNNFGKGLNLVEIKTEIKIFFFFNNLNSRKGNQGSSNIHSSRRKSGMISSLYQQKTLCLDGKLQQTSCSLDGDSYTRKPSRCIQQKIITG